MFIYSLKTFFIISIMLLASVVQSQTIRTLAVTGEAKQQLTPDAFTMNFTFEQKGEDLVSIKNSVDKSVNEATKLLIENNVSESNIRSMDVTVYPWVVSNERELLNKGFVYKRTVYFTHNDIDAYDTIIKKMAGMLPSQIGHLSLINQDIDKWQRKLMQAALKDAQVKAEEMASVMGVEVGHVLFMSDGTSPPEHMYERKGQMLMSQARDSASSMPGENTIISTVEVVFEIHTISSKPHN